MFNGLSKSSHIIHDGHANFFVFSEYFIRINWNKNVFRFHYVLKSYLYC
uniref:Uncharacterized protein n=1 Tax=Lepeophtheirus salmonis TaxID=72036 RepID=A0A0K2UX86_LEPSM